MDTLLIISKIETLYQHWGYLLVFISSFVEITPMGWTIPGGGILAAGGFFAFKNVYMLIGIILSGWAGAWLTLVLSYLLGDKTGNWLIKKLKQEKNALRAKRLLKNNGGVILTTAMLANLTRFWVAYVAGQQKYKFTRFLFYSGAASFTWVVLMVSVGFIVGIERGNLEKGLASLGALSWTFVALAVLIIFISVKNDLAEFKQDTPPKQDVL